MQKEHQLKTHHQRRGEEDSIPVIRRIPTMERMKWQTSFKMIQMRTRIIVMGRTAMTTIQMRILSSKMGIRKREGDYNVWMDPFAIYV